MVPPHLQAGHSLPSFFAITLKIEDGKMAKIVMRAKMAKMVMMAMMANLDLFMENLIW